MGLSIWQHGRAALGADQSVSWLSLPLPPSSSARILAMAPTAFPPDVVGIANLPNQQHQIAYRKGINFNLMVVGGCL